MKVYKVGEIIYPFNPFWSWCLSLVDFAFHPPRPSLGILAQQKAAAQVMSLAANLDARGTGWELFDCCHGATSENVHPICTLKGTKRENRSVVRRTDDELVHA
jgi:hypothetical protein